jgi:signal transduction histidine kinase
MTFTKRLTQIAQRVSQWRAPFVLGAYALALLAYALIVADCDAVSRVFMGTVTHLVYSLGVLALAASAACMVVVKKETSFRYILALYTCVTALLMIGYRLRLETYLLLVLANVMWTQLFEPFPTCLVLSCATASLLPTTLLLPGGHGLFAAAALALAGTVQAMCGSLLILKHEKTISLQRYINRLEENVASLTRANILSQEYAKGIETESRARERDRLTRDIHDAIGYTMTNTIMMMEAIKVMARAEPERIPAHIKKIRAHTEEGLARIKRILRDFRAQEHEAESVYWAIKKLVKVFTISTGLRVNYEMGNADIGDLERFPEAVYHFIQEGLINAFRHGHASRVMIIFWDYGESLRIMLDDDGIGCPNGVTSGIGIAGMQERAALVGGRVAVDPAETGFRISMHLPKGNGNVSQDEASHSG